MKTAGKLLSLFTVCAVSATMCSLTAFANEQQEKKIRIVIENNTLTAENGADWTGTLMDEWVTIGDDSTAVSAFTQALEAHGYTQTGAEYDYITEINGLSSEDGGAMGGWIVSLDDWVTDEAISAYTVSSGKLESGDELCFSYSCAWGADLDYDWSGADTSLRNVIFSAGELNTEFSGDNREYILSLPEGTDSVTVRPQVLNRAYRAKIYKNTYTPAESGTDCKFGTEIKVGEGDVIIIGVASPAWMQSNYNNAQESIYQFHIEKISVVDPLVQEAESLIASIGTVDEQSRSRIETARAFYDSLTDEQKQKVTNYDILTAAEEKISSLSPAPAQISLSQLRENAAKYFTKAPVFGNEWDVITLARLGLADDDLKNSYIESVKAKLEENGSSVLSNTRSTVNSGVVAALTAIGADPSDFYGYDLTAPLFDVEYVTRQGVNGAVYALIALNTHGYGNEDIEAKLISAILDSQEDDGGWTIDTWSGTDDGSDADMTAMALQALAPYTGKDEDVSLAIERAVDFLRNNQTANAGFVSYGSEDCESCAQVLTALCAMNTDIRSDFVKNGTTVYDSLTRFYNDSDKGFSHLAGGESNYLSSYQAYIAAAALYRYGNGLTSIFDMTDTSLKVYKNETKPESSDESSASAPVPDEKPVPTGEQGTAGMLTVLLLSSAAVLAVLKKRRIN